MIYRDRYNRPLESLRLIVTQRCNYACWFCHREGDFYNGRSEMKPGHYEVLARGARGVGVTDYKITGGEPLIRDDIIEIVKSIRPYSSSISLTTNGSLLRRWAGELRDSGLHHVNVSLHTLNEEKFRRLTRGDLRSVLEGIEESLERGLRIKLNVVVLKENVNDIPDIIEFASNKGLGVNLIQLMPVFYFVKDPLERIELYRRMNGDMWVVEAMLRESATHIELRQPHNRVRYVMPSGIEVIVIKGYSNPFACLSCTRMRVTHDGLIKTCLYRDEPTVDIRECLEDGDDKCVQGKLLEALRLREPGFMLPLQLSYTYLPEGARRNGGN